MSEYIVKHFPLKQLFVHKRGVSKYTKSYCNNNHGDYQVFTGTTIGTFGFIDTYDYDTPHLTYTSNGEYAGTVELIKNSRYSVGANRCVLIEKDVENLYLPYIANVLEPILKNIVRYDNYPYLTWEIIKDIFIPIPTLTNGTFDIHTQISISQKYEMIRERRKTLLQDKYTLLQVSIEIDISNYKYRMCKVQEIIDLSKSQTNGSKFTLSFINEHPGEIPVYGAVKFDNKPSYGYVQDDAIIADKTNGNRREIKVKYFQDCLTYNIDGQGGCGYVFYRRGRFSLSEKVKPLPIRNEYNDLLDPLYLKYMLQPLFLANVRGRKITKEIIQNLLVPIPINEDGTFDLDTQKLIATKYKKMEEIKLALCKQIDSVLETSVEFY